MNVRVDEAGDNVFSGRVKDARACRDVQFLRLADFLNAAVFNQNTGTRKGRGTCPINERFPLNDDNRGSR